MLPRFNYRLWKPQCLRALRTTTRLLGRHSEKAALELYQQQLLMHAEPDLFDHPNTAMKKVCSTFVCSLPSTSASFSCTSSVCYFPSAQLFLPYGFMCARLCCAVLCLDQAQPCRFGSARTQRRTHTVLSSLSMPTAVLVSRPGEDSLGGPKVPSESDGWQAAVPRGLCCHMSLHRWSKPRHKLLR